MYRIGYVTDESHGHGKGLRVKLEIFVLVDTSTVGWYERINHSIIALLDYLSSTLLRGVSRAKK
jgi:hypothetical protein